MKVESYQLRSLEKAAGCVTAHMVIPEELYYFDGHFDKVPVLPGVVQVTWAMELAKEHLALKGQLSSIESIKFTSIIRPGASMSLSLQYYPEKERLVFTYSVGDKTYSTGKIKVT